MTQIPEGTIRETYDAIQEKVLVINKNGDYQDAEGNVYDKNAVVWMKFTKIVDTRFNRKAFVNEYVVAKPGL